MTHADLMRRHKVKSELSDLTREEREMYDVFLELADTDTDVRILSDAWLRHHARKNR